MCPFSFHTKRDYMYRNIVVTGSAVVVVNARSQQCFSFLHFRKCAMRRILHTVMFVDNVHVSYE